VGRLGPSQPTRLCHGPATTGSRRRIRDASPSGSGGSSDSGSLDRVMAARLATRSAQQASAAQRKLPDACGLHEVQHRTWSCSEPAAVTRWQTRTKYARGGGSGVFWTRACLCYELTGYKVGLGSWPGTPAGLVQSTCIPATVKASTNAVGVRRRRVRILRFTMTPIATR
jgi:hypothetical protein